MSPQTIREKALLRLPPEEGPVFQIAPMIDIMLVMLVFFMSICSTEVMDWRKDINLPTAQLQKIGIYSGGLTIVNVTWTIIDNTGSVEIDGRTFSSAAGVRDYLRTKVTHNPHMRVLIRADRDVRYDYLRTLMKAIGDAGASRISFSVVDWGPSPTPKHIP